MFPQAKSIFGHVFHGELGSIINKGTKEPYTFENLYESPPDHTYAGLGKRLEEYCLELKREGKELTFWRFIFFFEWKTFILFFTSVLCPLLQFTLNLKIQTFLEWIEDKDNHFGEGFLILMFIIIIYISRFISLVQANYLCFLLSPLTKNTLEVTSTFKSLS